MQLFELVSPRLFRPLAGPNRAFYAELLLLLWEECRHTADYSILRAEAVSRAEDYFAALAKPLALDADDAGDEAEQPTRDPHTLALGFLLRLRRTGWLAEQPGSYEEEPALAFVPEVTPLLEALEEILNPRVVTYTGKLYKAWQLLQNVGEEKSPYENVLREVAGDLEALNKSLRALNASIGHYIDRLTRNRTPQEVLELFDQYEEKVVAAAYHRFKTSDNLFNYRAFLEEGLDDCETNYLPQLALDYARVERCAPSEAAPAVRALIQKQRDALEEMSTLIREIDASHVRYRKRAVQRAQFLLLSDRSAQGSVTALLRRYAEDIKTPDQLFEPDDGPLAARLKLWPVQVFGEKPLYPPAAPRTDAPLAPVQAGQLDEEQLRREQKLLLDYARMAVTEENVDILARQALAARPSVSASTLADEYPNDFARIIGLHTYSQSPRRCYDIQLTGEWATRGGFRFEEFTLTPRKEDAEDDRNDKMLEECANYLLNHCFVLGGVEDQRAKYLYVQDHLNEVRAVFAPLGCSVVLYPAPLQAAALVNEHEGSQARLLKYESILLLVLRLLYLQKRESLSASADQVLVTVEEVQAELQKMNLPRRLDQPTLEKLLRTLRRYNLARPVGRLSGLDSRIEVFPTVLLALPDSDLADAAAEVTRTRSELSLYERPEDGTAAVEVEE